MGGEPLPGTPLSHTRSAGLKPHYRRVFLRQEKEALTRIRVLVGHTVQKRLPIDGVLRFPLRSLRRLPVMQFVMEHIEGAGKKRHK